MCGVGNLTTLLVVSDRVGKFNLMVVMAGDIGAWG